jgi:SpoVK/Ycf46/Vps4 family AAA+-type ATPase
MQPVTIRVDAAAFLAVLPEVVGGAVERGAALCLRVDGKAGTLTLLDEDEDSLYKVSLPLQVEGTPAEVLYCRIPAAKLETLSQMFPSPSGELTLTIRKVTLTFKCTKKQVVLPNEIAEEPASLRQMAQAAERYAFDQAEVVRFRIVDPAALLQALEPCEETALAVRVGDGKVHVYTEAFPAEVRKAGTYLWPRDTFCKRLAQLPPEHRVGVVVLNNSSVILTAGSAFTSRDRANVWREVYIQPFPATSLYISKAARGKNATAVRTGHGQPLWRNSALTNGATGERPHEKTPGHREGEHLATGDGGVENEPVQERRGLGPRQGAWDRSEELSGTEEFRENGNGEKQDSANKNGMTPGQGIANGQGLANGHDPANRLDHPTAQVPAIPLTPSHTHPTDLEVTAPDADATPPSLTALAHLEELPGLAEVKRQIRDIADFACFECERLQVVGSGDGKPHTNTTPTLHMAFLGNPGTGKTMVARMIGRIFKELGLISRGHVVEVDRSQLVGSYMGHTEANLTKAVKRAKGGILFIDEAYTLYKKDSGKDFGLTAINTLVKLMEDHRENLIVIVAGYKGPMREFFSYNPGLRERIPFHVEFPDYADDELLAIADHLAAHDHYELTDDARAALLRRVLREKIDETFGNARTVRNLLDKAKIHHAVRARDLSSEARQDEGLYTTLTAEDFTTSDAREDDTLDSLLDELDALVGLSEVKELVRQMVDVLSLEKKRFEHGLANLPLTFHMSFSGNPGTGKTTVARLIGRILRVLEFLPKGHFVEASRKDLVAGYVGQTALKTGEKIREALGGVLFVDEAYALARKGEAFGAEALATLIKEMEDKKGLVTVILAGYPQQMENLFAVNPGLKSRIRFHLHFPDYNASELVEIFKRKAAEESYLLTPDAEEKLWRCFISLSIEAAEAADLDQFGNGRLAEAMWERAKIRLSTRISQLEDVSREDLMTITEDEIEKL